jgi:very-short-patch-repair endonuclease
MTHNHNRQRARDLRRTQTEPEQFVWKKLRDRRFADFKFRRQFPLGNYIVDFVCLGCRLILELDGGHHGEPNQENYDATRDAWLRSQGFKVLRFWNHQVMSEWDIVEDTLWNELQAIPLTPNPSPAAGRGEK